jgi:hypothetical protein
MSPAVGNPIINRPFEEPSHCLKILRARFLAAPGMAACNL